MATSHREELRIPSGDTELAAWLYRPRDTGQDVPCVVLMHGFTVTHDEQLDRFCERFAAAGIAALAFDFRHLGSSGGEPRQLVDLHRQYEDCDAALLRARSLDGIDGERIAIWGTSFAGGHSLDAAARHPWLAAAICLVPLVDGAVPPPGMTPQRMAWSVAVGLRDTVRARRGASPYLVQAVGPKGSRAVLPNQYAWEAIPRLSPPHSLWRNEVAARILLKLSRHRPVKRAKDVQCPLLVQIVEGETLLRNGPAEKAVRRAPRGELRRYPGMDHVDPYLSPGFETVVEDQIAFLDAHGLTGAAGAPETEATEAPSA